MFKLSLRNIWSRKGRLFLTAFAVIAGTAFLSGVFVFTDTIKGSFNDMFATAYSKTDAVVRSSNVIEGDFGSNTRDSIDVSLVGVVAKVPHVTESWGDVTGHATVSFNGAIVGRDGPPKFAGAWIPSEGSPWRIVDGKGPAAATDVVIDRSSSKIGKIKVGDKVSITSSGQPRTFTVSGVATFAGSDTSGGATWSLFTLPTAQDFVLGDPTKIDAIIVRGDGKISDTELANSINTTIGNRSIEVLTGKQITAESQSAVAKSLSFITLFLSIFALIAMFVGSFIIYNV
ncbi:MAG: ABC transporter permease, partial [Actinomycetota bacterium]